MGTGHVLTYQMGHPSGQLGMPIAHAYQIQSSESPYCDYCQEKKDEDTKHYLLTCPKYKSPREIMIEKITMTMRLLLNQMTRDVQLGILFHGKTLQPGDGLAVA